MKTLLAAASLLTLAACSTEIPTCVPGPTEFRICDQDMLYVCPVGTPEQIAAADMLRAQCSPASPDFIECLSDLDYEYIDTTLVADCAAAGQVCVMTATSSDEAQCETPNAT